MVPGVFPPRSFHVVFLRVNERTGFRVSTTDVFVDQFIGVKIGNFFVTSISIIPVITRLW